LSRTEGGMTGEARNRKACIRQEFCVFYPDCINDNDYSPG
jgi:hypothetical protein